MLTKRGFKPAQRAYGATLPTPTSVLLATTPAGSGFVERMLATSSYKLKMDFLKELLSCSTAIVLLGEIATVGAHRERKVLYMHTRTHWLGDGQASALLEQAQLEAAEAGVALFADAAACRTWDASLVLLRNWFSCSLDIWTADLPKPGETPTGKSHHLVFRWTPGTSRHEHATFVRVAANKQLARRSPTGLEYGAELLAVTECLERKLAATP